MSRISTLFRYPMILIFGGLILVTTTLDLLSPPKTFSEMENRYLAEKPEMTLRSLLEEDDEKKYTALYEKYTNDQFIGRDQWITLKSVTESALGKIENNGIAYGADHYMFAKMEYFSDLQQRQLPKNISFIQQMAQAYPEMEIDFALIPNSYAVLTEKVPLGLENIDQEAEISRIYGELTAPNLQKLDLLEPLRAHEEEYIYYRTDHHWTTLGAYYGYSAYVEAKGMEPVPLEELAPHQVEGFYGTYYSKAKAFDAVADTITWYDIPVTSVEVNGEEKGGLYDLSQFEKRDKYAGLLWSNNGLTVIKSGCNRYHQEGKTSRILLLKDSYGNSLAPFLAYNYDEVWVVDMRYTAKLSPILEMADFDQVAVMYNYTTFTEDSNVYKMAS